jgi:hypothetical protein
MLTQEVIDALNKLEKKLNKKICCQDCLEIAETCEDGESVIWDSATSSWICGSGGGGGGVSSLESLTGDVTLSEGGNINLNIVGNDIEISATGVSLDSNQETTDTIDLTGQQITINPATGSTYGVVKLDDLFAQFERVDTYADLPDPTLHTDEYYHVVNSQGSAFWPGWIGGTFYSKGFYYSDGSAWEFVGEVPYQASQADVDAGIITDQFVSPATLASASKWATKNDSIQFKEEGVNLGAAGTVDTIDFVGSAVTATRVADVLTVTVTGSSPAVISPTQITSDQDNYNPTGFSTATLVRLDFDTGGRAITGFAAGTDGQRITLSNISGNFGYYPGGHPDSSAGNRIITEKDFIHFPYQSIDIVYDSTSSGWRILSDYTNDRKTGLFYEYSAGNPNTGDNNALAALAISTGTTANTASTTSLPAATTAGISAGAASGHILYFSDAVVTYTSFGSSHQYVEAFISIPTLSNATDRFTIELQLTNTPSSTTLENNNTVGIRYQDDINSGEWELFSQDNAGAESVADTNVLVAINTTYRLGLWIDKANSEARAYINGTYVGRVTGNLPTASVNGARIIIIRTGGNTNARTVNVHRLAAGAIYQ